ncbi:MAG TPA: YggT family protein [Acidimicrobiia bacterium]|nr:YggT family protein [Acidimicrobiia bacterium]
MDIGGVLILILQIYFYAVLAWVILSWIPTSSDHPLGRVNVFLDRVIYPVILPLRRVIPPVRLGGGMLDLSPIVLLIGIQLLIRLVRGIF